MSPDYEVPLLLAGLSFGIPLGVLLAKWVRRHKVLKDSRVRMEWELGMILATAGPDEEA